MYVHNLSAYFYTNKPKSYSQAQPPSAIKNGKGLSSVSGTDITVTGAAGSVLDSQDSRWWDGEGTNGGKTKPKFFYAHSLKSSSISGITIKNSPVQIFSVNSTSALTLSGITIDNSAGDTAGGHNTDAFDVGSSDGITISGANVKNQDDCLAINSGTVCLPFP
jgi:polygalacturonase